MSPSTYSRLRHVVHEHGLAGLWRLLRHPARSGPRPVTVPVGPRHLQVEVSGKCNLKCPFCPRTFSDLGWENLSLESFRAVIGSVPAGQLESINLQGFGEPLLNPELIEMVRWSREKALRVGLTTNGTLLDERNTLGLLEAGLQWLAISIDGATSETFERLRVGAKFDRVKANVRRAAELAAARDLRLSLQWVCMRSNFAEIPQLFDLAVEVGVKIIVLTPVFELTSEVPAERLTPDQEQQLTGFARLGRTRGLDVLVVPTGRHPEPGLPCDWPWRRSFITAEGDMKLCCVDTESTLGNVLTDGIDRVWHGETYTAIRAGLLNGSPHPICAKHCFSKGIAQGY